MLFTNAPTGHASDGRLEGTLDGLKLGAVEGCLDNVDVKVGLGDVEGTCDGHVLPIVDTSSEVKFPPFWIRVEPKCSV